MPHINILSPHVADLIAAGEVVDRPASVIKELMENSFDAGASHVTVEIRNGGATMIRITDDGCGMAPEDAGIAFLRHATSKLQDESGLEAITTMGFRGEALAAISAVSRISLTTRRPEDPEGIRMTLLAGDIEEMEPAGCPAGTVMSVEDLFYNTPARLKFLKTDRSEASACIQAGLRCALGRPEISVRFLRDGKEEFFTPGDGDPMSCCYALLGREAAADLLQVYSEDSGLKLRGFVSSPAAGRGNRSAQYFFVNGRYIRSQLLQSALEQAYRNTLLTGRYPACVLWLEIRPGSVDVNVHPAKTEVKFSEERRVFSLLYQAVQATLQQEDRLGLSRGDRSDGASGREAGDPIIPAAAPADPVGPATPLTDRSVPAASAGLAGLAGSRPSVPSDPADPVFRPAGAAASAGPTAAETPTAPTLSRTAAPPAQPAVPGPGPAPETSWNRGSGDVSDPALSSASLSQAVPGVPSAQPGRYGASAQEPERDGASKQEPDPELFRQQSLFASPTAEYRIGEGSASAPAEDTAADSAGEAANSVPAHRILGEAFRTYIIVECGDRIVLIDKHAAHERMNFDRLRARTQPAAAQQLLLPKPLRLGPEELALTEQFGELLAEFGFELEPFGPGERILRAAPADLRLEDAVPALEEILEHLRSGGSPDPAAARDEILHTVACKAAIKAGWDTSAQELERLAVEVLSGRVKYCPHGRPVSVTVTRKDLDRLFKRIV
ncbi:MAG: DNA mismatch repair endonuclease MutL [Oscillospiraceae bacterium]|nr:DNA mismatch repair endonuclease MutL [Oscillospiraceae bacterium]